MTSRDKLISRVKQVAFAALRLIYRFDLWHVRLNRENCLYFGAVKDAVQRLPTDAVVDIGCGLGEVVAGLPVTARWGIDRDEKVLRAARLIRGRRVHFVSSRDCQQIQPALPRRVTAICLNWLHTCPPSEAVKIVQNYAGYIKPEYIIHDVIIYKEGSRYKYHHPESLLVDVGTIVEVRDGGDGIRKLVTIACREATIA